MNQEQTNEANGSEGWEPLETSTHQDHVIKHVIGATVLGWLIAGDAAHLLLDIGFLWTIYLDGEMGLVPEGMAIAELEGDEITPANRAELAFDAQLLLSEGQWAEGLKRFIPAAGECLIETVEFFGTGGNRRLVVQGETSQITIDTSLETAEVLVKIEART